VAVDAREEPQNRGKIQANTDNHLTNRRIKKTIAYPCPREQNEGGADQGEKR